MLRTGQPQLNPSLSDADLETVARDADHLRLLRELGPCSSLIAPLVVAGRPAGALELTYGPSGRHYGPADLPLVEELARRAAIAIENARLYQEARLATEQLAAALDELRRAQSRIVEQERLRAMGEMASGIAHDFNNQLAIIVGLTDPELWSDERLGDRGAVAATLAAIASAADDAAEVVHRLREFYRPSGETGGEHGRLDLGELVAQVVAATQPRWRGQALGRGATIDVRVDVGSAAPVLGSASELREALTA